MDVWLEFATHSMFYSWIATAAFGAFFALPALVLLWRAPRRMQAIILIDVLVFDTLMSDAHVRLSAFNIRLLPLFPN